MPMHSLSSSTNHYAYLASSFLGFATHRRCPPFPSRLHLQTQTRCNARCAMCPHPSVSRTWQHGTMDWSLFDDITRQVAAEPGPVTVIFDLQNEPLLNPDIFAWVRHMKVRAPSTRCVLLTNGSLLDRFAPVDIDASRIDILAVSLNAHTRETYEKLNCGLDFDAVKGNIERLVEAPGLKPRLRVDFVDTRVNHDELHEARKFWKERGIRVFSKPLSNRAGALGDFATLAPEEQGRGGPASAVRRLMRSRSGCPLPFFQMSVLHNGDAILCCHDWNHACVVGTVAGQSLREIWDSFTLRGIRQALLSGNAAAVTPCNSCSLARK
ncbi:MAG: radical SAM protein [Dehalococcoidia bacterium]|nr:radical SAM protein [Dehalococcoidia bacterium]